jgi:hypothetical protein
MPPKTSRFLLALAVASALASCGGGSLRIAPAPDAGAAGTFVTGAAGASAAGTAGAAGTGSSGGVAPPRPLGLSATVAVTRMAELLWHDQPDDAVLAQAAQGQFKTAEDLAPVVRQMLADPRAGVGVGAFYRWWLDLDEIAMIAKDPAVFPAYTPELQADLAKETETFGVQLTLASNASYATLMTAPYSFIDVRLAELYGVAGVTGDDLRRVDLDGAQRAGILTQASTQVLVSLAKRNAPSLRGKFLNEKVFCRGIPAAPLTPSSQSSIDQLIAAPGVTVRAALAMILQQSAACAACHTLMDPHGLAFETYDAIGQWRTTDNGAPVDLSGITVQDLDPNGGAVKIAGPVDYATYAATSEAAQTCFARHWLAFARGAMLDSVPDPGVAPVLQKFKDSGLDLRELIVDALTSDFFLAR